MAVIMKGAPVASAISEALTERTEALRARGVEPCLAILRVGARGDDLAYERGALRRCEKVGVRTKQILLPADCAEEDVIAEIEKINRDDSVHGCLMFRPLPKRMNEHRVSETLLPVKDVDSMTSASLHTMFTGRGDGYPPCTARSCIELLDHYGYEITGKRVVVIGRSLVIGRPVAMMLQSRDGTVTICHRKTVDLPAICREAEILVSAAGEPGLVDLRYTNPDQVIIDVGINALPDGSLCGDVRFDEVAPRVKAISPVPSGVGSVTTAVLCKHVIEAAERLTAEKAAF